jgi:hypothetical protein
MSDYGWTDAEWYYSGMFHTAAEAHNAPPVSFLIKDFLQCDGVTAIAAPVRERKSIIALNIAHALVTGEKLFDYFEVVQKPKRVLYLNPETGLSSFTERIKKIGLLDYVGWSFFYRTMSADGRLDLTDEVFQMALPGSVVFLDTLARFLPPGADENSATDMRAFADTLFSLLKKGAESIVVLHHTPKNVGDTMSLENALRGSGDVGACLTTAWGTKLQDPAHPYESASYLENLKQRDFESKPFEVTCGSDLRMRIVGDPSTNPARLQTRRGNPANKDGMDQAAEVILRANVDMPVRKLQEALAARGISRGTTWISKTRARIKGTGVTLVEG